MTIVPAPHHQCSGDHYSGDRRILCLWLPALAIDRACMGQASLRHQPAAIVRQDHERLVIAACNLLAEHAGVIPGQGLSDARILCPALKAIDADHAGDRRLLDRIAASCLRYTPWVGNDLATSIFEGGFLLDISGCAHLFGGETALLCDMTERFTARGFQIRAAIADSPGAAWAWSHFGPLKRTAVIPPKKQRDFLSALPVACLRLPAEMLETLDQLGLRRVQDLLPLPRAPLAARFGPLLGRRLDQALGREEEPVNPQRPPPAYHVQHMFPEAVQQPEAIMQTLQHLLHDMQAQLTADGLGARHMVLSLFQVDGTCADAHIGTSRPTRDPALLLRLFAPKLDALRATPETDIAAAETTAIESMVLATTRTSPFQPHQIAAVKQAHSGALAATSYDDLSALHGLIDRLGNRLSPDQVFFVHPRESMLPEAQNRLCPALHHAPSQDWDHWWQAHRSQTRGAQAVRLFSQPERLEACKARATAPDSPPRQFRWRRKTVTLQQVIGPERRAGPWWTSEELPPRDYYQTEDDKGRRLWVFQCLHSSQWYIHGIFG